MIFSGLTAGSTAEYVEAVIDCFERWETDYPEGGEELERAIASRFRVLLGSGICPDDRDLGRAIREYFEAERHKCPVNSICIKVCAVKLRRRPPSRITCPIFLEAVQT
jgi:hypothetical protein